MDREELPWLLRVLENISYGFYEMYNVQLLIPNIIHISHSEVKSWFQMNKNKIMSLDDEFYKIQCVREYYQKKVQSFKNTEYSEQINKNVCYVIQKKNGNDYFKILDYENFMKIFNNPSENQEFINTFCKIFDCFLNQDDRNLKLYEIKLTKETVEQKNNQIKIQIQNFECSHIKSKEYEKNLGNPPKTTSNSIIKSKLTKDIVQRSSLMNKQFENLINSICHFLESKLKKAVAQLNLQVILDGNNKIWIIGANSIKIHKDQSIEPINITEQILVSKIKKQKSGTCKGVYCDYEQFFQVQDSDQKTNIYFMKNKNPKSTSKSILVTKKSIILDQIERLKSIERIQQLCQLDHNQVKLLSEVLLFKCRKFYSISDIQKSDLKHFKQINNIYEKVQICRSCEYFYQNIDNLRFEKQNNQLSDKEVQNLVGQYLEKSKNGPQIKKQIFSQEFYENLKPIDKRLFTFEAQVDECYFQNQNIQKYRRQIKKPIINYNTEFQDINLPIVYTYKYKTVQGNECFKIKHKIKNIDTESLALKHLLGHKKNVPKSANGFIVSQSTIKMNKIQDSLAYAQQLAIFDDNNKTIRSISENKIQILSQKNQIYQKNSEKKIQKEEFQKKIALNENHIIERNCQLVKSVQNYFQKQHNFEI